MKLFVKRELRQLRNSCRGARAFKPNDAWNAIRPMTLD